MTRLRAKLLHSDPPFSTRHTPRFLLLSRQPTTAGTALRAFSIRLDEPACPSPTLVIGQQCTGARSGVSLRLGRLHDGVHIALGLTDQSSELGTSSQGVSNHFQRLV